MLHCCKIIAIGILIFLGIVIITNNILFLRKKIKHRQEYMQDEKAWQEKRKTAQRCQYCHAILSNECIVCWNCGKKVEKVKKYTYFYSTFLGNGPLYKCTEKLVTPDRQPGMEIDARYSITVMRLSLAVNPVQLRISCLHSILMTVGCMHKCLGSHKYVIIPLVGGCQQVAHGTHNSVFWIQVPDDIIVVR